MINKKVAYIISIIVFFLSSYGSYGFFSNNTGSLKMLSPISDYKAPGSNGTKGVTPTVSNEPKTEECPLNGALFSKTQRSKWESRRPLGIMVENHKEARPQSGISSADVVYEAVAEGGITRFLTIFYCQDSSFVGPIRSARIYFIKLLQGYGEYPLYAHVGGANTEGPADALGEIKDLGWGLYNDLNQFSVPFPYFWRDYERLPNVATEHTVYSSTSKLWNYAQSKRKLSDKDEDEKSWNKTFSSWKFSDDEKQEKRGDVAQVSFGFWTQFADDYAIAWNYDKTTNTYKRENGGKPHTDKNTGKQLESKNVIVVFTKESSANDGYEGGHILYKLIGKGDALVFQNGNAVKATWNKKDEESTMKFYDENGKEISIIRGQVFVEILPIGNKVTY